MSSLPAQLGSALSDQFVAAVTTLQSSTWGADEMMMPDKQQQRAIKQLAKELTTVIDAYISLESETYRSLTQQLGVLATKAAAISTSLGAPPPPPPDSSKPLNTRLQNARSAIKALEAMKQQRLATIDPLIAEYNNLEVTKSSLSDRPPAKLEPTDFLDGGAEETVTSMIKSTVVAIGQLRADEAALKVSNDKLLSDLKVDMTLPDSPVKSDGSARATNRSLKKLKKERVDELTKLGETMVALWNDLDVSVEERKDFKDKITKTGLTPETRKIGEVEVAKLRKKKASARSEELGGVREEIKKHWAMCGYSQEQQQKSFPDFNLSDDEDTLPAKLQAYWAKLADEYEKKKPVLVLMQKYNDLTKFRLELFELENSQTSSLGERRNSIGTTERLGKLNSTVKELPSVLTSLVTLVKTIEGTPVSLPDGRQVRRPFMFDGERFLVKVDKAEKAFRALKEEAKQQREQRKLEKRVGATAKGTPSLKAAGMMVAAGARAKTKLAGGKVSPGAKKVLVRSPSGAVVSPKPATLENQKTRRRSSPVRPPGGPGLTPPSRK